MYRIIRAGTNFDPVVVITPEDASPDSAGVRCYERKSWATEGREPEVFYEISVREAQLAFCGHADGWGFAELPQRPFASLEDIGRWIAERSGTKKHPVRPQLAADMAESSS